MVFDFGIGDLSTQALTNLLQALASVTDEQASGERDTEKKKQQAIQQALGAAAMLNPTFHIYDIAARYGGCRGGSDRQKRRAHLSRRRAMRPQATLVIRGFDAIPQLSAGMPFAEYLPVLREMGVEEKAPDETPRVRFPLGFGAPEMAFDQWKRRQRLVRRDAA